MHEVLLAGRLAVVVIGGPIASNVVLCRRSHRVMVLVVAIRVLIFHALVVYEVVRK